MFRVLLSRVERFLPLCLALAATPLAAATFTQPLHLTREVSDSISARTQAIEEYYAGDRAVVLAGEKTIVVDTKAGTITRIDRASGTYSIARIPTARPVAKSAGSAAPRALTPVTLAGRHAEVVEFESTTADRRETTRIAATADVALTSAQVELLAAVHGMLPEHALKALRTSAPSAQSAGATYKLPLQVTTVWQLGGETLETSNTVVRIDHELAPQELAAIPPGARRVEPPADITASMRELEVPSGR